MNQRGFSIFLALVGLTLSATACGDDDRSGDAGMCLPLGATCGAGSPPCCAPNGCAAGMCGAPRVDGGGVDGGGVVVDGGGADASVSTCPTEPPADMTPCTDEGTSCIWLRCTAEGEVRAACASGAWTVDATACSTHDCEGTLCDGDQLCVQRIGGAFIVECGDNPCSDGPVVASCACALCGGAQCTVTGTTVSCNTCPSGKCP